ncbi:MAG TPA: HAMP domain-containing sensor histidine kinase [Bordetella sp.]|nr:HAMP domain-containing sensor histidine kinase [Bordetella sp.]
MKLWRTTAFRLLLLYAGVFAILVGTILGLDYWRTADYIARQAVNLISWEARYLRALRPERLTEEVVALSRDVPRRINYYGLFGPDGSWLAGDITALPPAVPGDHRLHRVNSKLQLQNGNDLPETLAMAVVLRNGGTLVLMRDVSEITQLRDTLLHSILWSSLIIILAGAGLGWLYSMRQWGRIRRIEQVAGRIAQGNMRERLPAGSRDELDLFGGVVNRMLDDIGRLMAEVKGACDGIAHDLRTPLTHVRSLLRQLLAHDVQAESRALLEQAVAQTDLLLQRFAAMLRISEIEAMSRREGFADVSLQALLQEVGELYEPLAEDGRISLSVRTVDLPPIKGDRPLLFEALCNLVDNAIKFTPAGGSVRLELSGHARGPCIEVADNGAGIAESEREAVVQRFYRSPRTRDLPGSGLGLSVVSAVLHLHDFSLGIASADPGTRMIVQCWPHRTP